MEVETVKTWTKSALKTALLTLAITLPLYLTVTETSISRQAERTLKPPPVEVPATTAREVIVTGLCTFGDFPVATTDCTTACTTETTVYGLGKVEDVVVAKNATTESATEWVGDVECANESNDGYTVTCWVTAYCGCYECSGEYGPYDVFGNRCMPNHTIGVDPSVIPYGTQVEINGIVYTASDTGYISGYVIDVYHETHEECAAWATGYYDVTILN